MTEPLDHESDRESGQRLINHEIAPKPLQTSCCSAATRGESLSRGLRKSQNESVKKNLVIESCESILESFHKGLEILLRICVRDESRGNHTMNRMLDQAIDFGDRHRKAIDIAGGVWLAFTSAAYIPFLPIPTIPYVTDSNSWMLAAIWNGGWWGFAHPALQRRRVAREAEADAANEAPNHSAD